MHTVPGIDFYKSVTYYCDTVFRDDAFYSGRDEYDVGAIWFSLLSFHKQLIL